MSFQDCVRKGLVFKAGTDPHRITGELEVAERFLSKARGLVKPDYYDVSLMLSYTSMFHSARSLLFRKGYSEKSHACLVLAVKEFFKGDGGTPGFA
ncbi:MAG: HEPN domain-containing protein [Candidatus Micrarchaeota archaeon]